MKTYEINITVKIQSDFEDESKVEQFCTKSVDDMATELMSHLADEYPDIDIEVPRIIKI